MKTQYMVVMDNGNSYNNEKIYYIRECFSSSELFNIITTCYAVGHYFKMASGPKLS